MPCCALHSFWSWRSYWFNLYTVPLCSVAFGVFSTSQSCVPFFLWKVRAKWLCNLSSDINVSVFDVCIQVLIRTLRYKDHLKLLDTYAQNIQNKYILVSFHMSGWEPCGWRHGLGRRLRLAQPGGEIRAEGAPHVMCRFFDVRKFTQKRV